MQTFLPHPDFEESARILDWKRLGKQRVEAFGIIRTLCGYSNSYQYSPVTRMWTGHLQWLIRYYNAMIKEWERRGYTNNLPILNDTDHYEPEFRYLVSGGYPCWLGMSLLHSSHRATLLWKAPEWYNQFGWSETPQYGYFWPILGAPELGRCGYGEIKPSKENATGPESGVLLHGSTMETDTVAMADNHIDVDTLDNLPTVHFDGLVGIE